MIENQLASFRIRIWERVCSKFIVFMSDAVRNKLMLLPFLFFFVSQKNQEKKTLKA